MEDLKAMFSSLDELLNKTDLEDVTAESTGYQDLPDGYYLSEVEKAEIKESKTSHQPMVSLQLKVVEEGKGTDEDGEYVTLKGTKNRKIFIYYVLKDEGSVQRFVRDMLKFEGEVEGEPILGKEYFTNTELLEDALEILEGLRIFVQCSTTVKDDVSTTWKNLISWKRAKALELN